MICGPPLQSTTTFFTWWDLVNPIPQIFSENVLAEWLPVIGGGSCSPRAIMQMLVSAKQQPLRQNQDMFIFKALR